MSDFVIPGTADDLSAPDSVAQQAYAKETSPFWERGLAHMRQGGPLSDLNTGLAITEAEDPNQALAAKYAAAGVTTPENYEDIAKLPPPPKLSAADANKSYSPPGETLFSGPVTEDAAKLISQAKYKEIRRNEVLGRFANDHNAISMFGMGVATSLLDPLNDAAMLVPGVGEGAIMAGLGRIGVTEGIAARTAARAVSTATGAAAGIAPLTAMKYGTGTLYNSDYDLRSALRDVFYGAATGAIIHGGLGAAREFGFLKPDDIMRAPASQQHAAMSAAVAQIGDGREVEVEPIFHPGATAADVVQRQHQVWRDGFDLGLSQSRLSAATSEIYERSEERLARDKELQKAVTSETEFTPPPMERPLYTPEEVRPPAPAAIESRNVVEADIKDLAGSSLDGKTTYVNPNVPEELRPFLNIHETTEQGLVNQWRRENPSATTVPPEIYNAAHIKATAAERTAVEASGRDWKQYSEQMDGFIKASEKEDLSKAPADLDRYPYPAKDQEVRPTPEAATGTLQTPLSPVAPARPVQARPLGEGVKIEDELEQAERALTQAGPVHSEYADELLQTADDLGRVREREQAYAEAANCLNEGGF